MVERQYYTEQPLTGRSAEQVTESLARHAVNAGGKVDRGALDWDAALGELRAVLTPDQLTQLQREGTRGDEIGIRRPVGERNHGNPFSRLMRSDAL